MVMNAEVEALRDMWVNKSWYIHMMEYYYYTAGFLSLSTSDILGHCCTAALCIVGWVAATFPRPSCNDQKMSPDVAKCPLRNKITPDCYAAMRKNKFQPHTNSTDDMEGSHKYNLRQEKPYTACMINSSIHTLKFKTRQK